MSSFRLVKPLHTGDKPYKSYKEKLYLFLRLRLKNGIGKTEMHMKCIRNFHRSLKYFAARKFWNH